MRTGQRINARAEHTAEANMRVKTRSQSPFGVTGEGKPEIIKCTCELVYEGDLHGTGLLEEYQIRFPDGNITMHGLQQFTGTLGDLSGTFALHVNAKLKHGVYSSRQIVVPGSATDGLRGLRGKMSAHTADSEIIPVHFLYYFA